MRSEPETRHGTPCNDTRSVPAASMRIISGGQTGVDRAALDLAIELNIAHGGWCPAGRKAEDGTIPASYNLQETRSSTYHVRTEQNVIDSDGTLILYRGELSGGTKLTHRFAVRHRRPFLLIDLTQATAAEDIRIWLHENRIATLNIAGPRESSENGIARQAGELLRDVLTRCFTETEKPIKPSSTQPW